MENRKCLQCGFCCNEVSLKHDGFDFGTFEAYLKEFYVACTDVETEGEKLLDGGIVDSISVEYFESMGYSPNVVIFTSSKGHQKEPNKLMPLIWTVYKSISPVRQHH